MSLHYLIEKDLISCSPDASVKHVAEMMRDNNVGAIVITDEGRPTGIVTDRDIALRCVAEGTDCAGTISEIMSTGVETVSLDQGIFDVIQVMKSNEVRRVPVVDERGSCVGLLSFGDVYHLLGQELTDLLGPVAPESPKILDKAA